MRLRRRDLPVLDLVGDLLRLALLLAVGVDVGVGQDAVEPGLEIGARLELVEGAVCLGVGLLDEVLGVMWTARHAQRSRVELVEEWQGIGLEARLLLLRGFSASHVGTVGGLAGHGHRIPAYSGLLTGAQWSERPLSRVCVRQHLTSCGVQPSGAPRYSAGRGSISSGPLLRTLLTAVDTATASSRLGAAGIRSSRS